MTYDKATNSDTNCVVPETKTRPLAGQTNIINNNNNNNSDINGQTTTSKEDKEASLHYHQDNAAQIPDQNNHQQPVVGRFASSTSSDNTSSGGSIDASETVNHIESEDGEIIACGGSGSDSEAGRGLSETMRLEGNQNCEQKERIKSPACDDGTSPVSSCYNQVLDDEIRARLDKLNALSDLINSLERQSDEANGLFRDVLKCSTDRLSSIAKTLGTKSIRHGRVYHAAKLSVEQSQSDCQRACVQFERANNDHHLARQAIREAESKLKSIAGAGNGLIDNDTTTLTNDLSSKLKLQGDDISRIECDKDSSAFISNNNGDENDDDEDEKHNHKDETLAATHSLVNATTSSTIEPHKDVSSEKTSHEIITTTTTTTTTINTQPEESKIDSKNAQETNDTDDVDVNGSSLLPHQRDVAVVAAKLGEELNLATRRLQEAEELRCQSERQHLNEASKLMVAQENLLKLERQYGQSIKRSQLYFEEAKRFNARLNSVKSDINRIGDEILAAKQAYALTLSELEQFSEDLHEASSLLG